jgi:hypothetical protein
MDDASRFRHQRARASGDLPKGHLYTLDVVTYLRQWSVEVIDDLQLMALLRSQGDSTE